MKDMLLARVTMLTKDMIRMSDELKELRELLDKSEERQKKSIRNTHLHIVKCMK